MSNRYRSKPSEIEAVHWDGWDSDDVEAFAPDHIRISTDPATDRQYLELLAGKDGAQGWVDVPEGYWIVRPPGDLSDHWPVDPDYFANKYEPVDASEVSA